jgi:predicted dehydrogenase
MDLFGRKHRRSVEVIGEFGNISWDFFANTVTMTHVEERFSQTTAFSCERNDMFLAEASHFLECCAGRAEPRVSGDDAIMTLKVLLAGIRSAETGRRVSCP